MSADGAEPALARLIGASVVYELEECTTSVGRNEENDIVRRWIGVSSVPSVADTMACACEAILNELSQVLKGSKSISGSHAKIAINPRTKAVSAVDASNTL